MMFANSCCRDCNWNCENACAAFTEPSVLRHILRPESSHTPSAGSTPAFIMICWPAESPALSMLARHAAVITRCCQAIIRGMPMPQGESPVFVHWKKSYGRSAVSSGLSTALIGKSLTNTTAADRLEPPISSGISQRMQSSRSRGTSPLYSHTSYRLESLTVYRSILLPSGPYPVLTRFGGVDSASSIISASYPAIPDNPRISLASM